MEDSCPHNVGIIDGTKKQLVAVVQYDDLTECTKKYSDAKVIVVEDNGTIYFALYCEDLGECRQ